MQKPITKARICRVFCSMVTAVIATMPLAMADAVATASPVLGYSTANMDKQADPRTDFYQYAAGNWLQHTDIPDDETSVGGFSLLGKNLDRTLLDIIQDAAAAPVGAAGSGRQQIGDFYRAAMDLPRLDALGLAPLAADLQRLDNLDGPVALGELTARLQLGYGASPLVNAFTTPDAKQSTMTILLLDTGSRALSQDEYTKPDGQRIRDLYLDYITRMFQSAGDSLENARANAAVVLAMETELAGAELTPQQQIDPQLTYNILSLKDAQALLPALDLRAAITGLGMTPPATLQIPDPNGLRALAKLLSERPAAEVHTLLRWHVLSARAELLGQPWYGLQQAFTRQRLGLKTSEPREREVTKAIATELFHPLSQLYVEAYFPQSTRREITEMVGQIRAEFELRLRANPWLDDATRTAALQKLDKVDIAVGFPEKWIDFSSVVIQPDDYFGNVQRAGEFLMRRDFALLGKPVVIDRFATPGATTPIAVNAAYNPQYNNIDITAAIAQPPFFKPGADAAVNYCTIGAVIGHELTHGFDTYGRQFGPSGDMHDWWTPQATDEFTKRTAVLVEQYNQFQVLPGIKQNGTLTLTENTADLGGITLAHAALQRHLADNPLPDIDGMSADQRCFVAWAQMWAYKARMERLQYLASNDYHAIAPNRAVGPLLQLDAFHEAFHTREGDPMWRAPQQRVRIW